MPDDVLPLAEVISALRREIVAGAQEGEGADVRFQLGNIDLEFTVVAKREGGPKGSIKFAVLGIGAEVGADAKFAKERTQKVKLTLSPMQRLPDGSYGQVMINRTPEQQTTPPAREPLNRTP
jgi:hypothetical protein